MSVLEHSIVKRQSKLVKPVPQGSSLRVMEDVTTLQKDVKPLEQLKVFAQSVSKVTSKLVTDV